MNRKSERLEKEIKVYGIYGEALDKALEYAEAHRSEMLSKDDLIDWLQSEFKGRLLVKDYGFHMTFFTCEDNVANTTFRVHFVKGNGLHVLNYTEFASEIRERKRVLKECVESLKSNTNITR